MKAIWNNQVIAESEETTVVESNHYFPANSVNKEFITQSTKKTGCPWKGEASYYNIVVDGELCAQCLAQSRNLDIVRCFDC